MRNSCKPEAVVFVLIVCFLPLSVKAVNLDYGNIAKLMQGMADVMMAWSAMNSQNMPANVPMTTMPNTPMTAMPNMPMTTMPNIANMQSMNPVNKLGLMPENMNNGGINPSSVQRGNDTQNPGNQVQTGQILDGIWQGRSGENLIIDGQRFYIGSNRRALQGYISVSTNWFDTFVPATRLRKRYLYYRRNDKLLLRNTTNGQFLYFQLNRQGSGGGGVIQNSNRYDGERRSVSPNTYVNPNISINGNGLALPEGFQQGSNYP